MRTKSLILSALITLVMLVPAVAQDHSEPKRNGQDIYYPYPQPNISDVIEPFADRGYWETNHSAFFADVRAGGFIDTSFGDTAVYIGHIISTGRADGWPTIAFTGLDSVKIGVSYRRVSRTGDVFAYGPWTTYPADTVTLTTKRSYGTGRGGGRDTLIVRPNPTGVGGVSDSSWRTAQTPYIQYRYTVISTRTDVSAIRKANIDQPENKRFNYHWLGEAVLTFTRRYL